MKTVTQFVNCNGCVACCVNDAIILHPECGDDPANYEHVIDVTHPFTGKPAKMLDHKPNGDCIYLGDTGCTIYSKRPAICREYSCTSQFLSMTRNERRLLIKKGVMSKDKFAAARARLKESA